MSRYIFIDFRNLILFDNLSKFIGIVLGKGWYMLYCLFYIWGCRFGYMYKFLGMDNFCCM